MAHRIHHGIHRDDHGLPERDAEAEHEGGDVAVLPQIVDDLLDATATTGVLGKTAGSDEVRGKATYPAFFGVEETRLKAKKAVRSAIEALEDFDEKAEPLRALAEYIYTRSN